MKSRHLTSTAAFVAGVAIAIAVGAWAQQAGYPSRIIATSLRVAGVDLTPSTGTFNFTLDDGCTTSPVIAAQYNKIGSVVVLELTQGVLTCTSDSLFFRTTGAEMPAAIRPAQNITIPMLGKGQNDTVNEAVCFEITSAGNFQILRRTAITATCLGAAGWTAAGTKEYTWSGAAGTIAFAYGTN